MKSLLKVKGFEKQTSWKVMRFSLENEQKSVESLGDTDVQIVLYIPAQFVSLRVAEIEQLYQVKRMIGGIVNKTMEDEREERKRGREREKKEKREKERERERERERKKERERERERPSVCPFNTPACVRSKRPRVCRQHAHMLKKHVGMLPVTHGDILNAHTGTC